MGLEQLTRWTAAITPLNEDLSVDITSLEKILHEQAEHGFGLLLLGSTGEGLNLNLQQKQEIIKTALGLKLKTPIMVGVPGFDLASSCEWLRYCESLPIDAYLMVTPIYARPGDEGQYRWFKALMDSVTKPVMLYNIPKRAGAQLSLEAVKRLSMHRNFWSIKDSSGSIEQLQKYQQASNKPVFCGDDVAMPEFARHGSPGLVSVASNIWPKVLSRIIELSLNKSFMHEDFFTNACEQLFASTNPVGIKRLMFEQGRLKSPILMPPLSHHDNHNLLALLKLDHQMMRLFDL